MAYNTQDAATVKDGDENAQKMNASSRVLDDLKTEVRRREGDRSELEVRWLDDLRRFHGVYDEKTQKLLDDSERSQVFVNVTRVKTNAMAAKLSDMLFPTDDLNWGIEATAYPQLVRVALEATQITDEATATAQAQQGQPGAEAAGQLANSAASVSQKLVAEREEAVRRAAGMQEQIKDQLDESNWPAKARVVIMDACKMGAGVVKGPIAGGKKRRGWKKSSAPPGEEDRLPEDAFDLVWTEPEQPTVKRVDPWNFFPDMSVANVEDGEGVFERHMLNKKQMRELAKEDGFDRDAIRRIIQTPASTSESAYLSELRAIGEGAVTTDKGCYCVWEYSGPIEAGDLKGLYQDAGDKEGENEAEKYDILDQVNAIVWFCDYEILKVAPYPLDSGETLYSVFRIEPDEASIFGRGMPSLLNDAQSIINGVWRIILDHGGATAGPQIVIDKTQIEPEDGDWIPRSFKVWKRDSIGNMGGAKPFDMFQVNSALGEMLAIEQRAMMLADEVAGMPAFAQGEQGTGVTKTAQGMAILTSAGNIVFRKIVKQFDDDVPETLIRRFFDWNMQFSPREEIKGDHKVIARGSSVLMVREMQAQNLIAMADRYGGHPVFGPMLRDNGLPLLRRIMQAHMLKADEIILTDDEFKKMLDDMAAQAAEAEGDGGAEQRRMEIETRKIEQADAELDAKVGMANATNEMAKEIALIQQDTAMMTSAEASNKGDADRAAKAFDRREDRASKERGVAVEVGMQERTGVSSGGSV